MNDFIAIDFETASSSPESAISIGLVKFRNYKPIGSYYSLIRPPKLYIRPDFTEIHGLTVKDIKDAPDFASLWQTEIRHFFTTVPFVAHNAPFDMNVLCSTLAYYQIPLPKINCFCSLKLSRRTWPDLSSHSLSALAETFGISYNAHNALSDAETCGKIAALCAEACCKDKTQKLPFISVVQNMEARMKQKYLMPPNVITSRLTNNEVLLKHDNKEKSEETDFGTDLLY